VEAARDLIAEVLEDRAATIIGPPAPLVLQTSTDAVHSTLADQLSAALRSAGLQVLVDRVEPGAYLERAAEEQPAAIRLGWSPDEATLRPWTEELFGAGTLGRRLTGWQPAPLRDLLGQATASADPEVRQRLWQQVERLALDAAVVAPVLHYRDDLLVADEVEGLVRDPYGNVDLTAVRVAAG
jgi:dipeptide transport system substrate-binding protein